MTQTDSRPLVLRLLTTRGPMTRSALVRASGLPYSAVSLALTYLQEWAKIEPVPGSLVRTGTRGRPSQVWRVMEAE